jgi:hypothetical protein
MEPSHGGPRTLANVRGRRRTRSEVSMQRTALFVLASPMGAIAACSSGGEVGTSSSSTAATAVTASVSISSSTGSTTSTGGGGSSGAGASMSVGTGGVGGSAPAACNGYEPCGVNPVVTPAGYTLASSPGITVFNQRPTRRAATSPTAICGTPTSPETGKASPANTIEWAHLFRGSSRATSFTRSRSE